MVVEFVKPHGVFPPGRVADLAGGVADVLIRRGIARPAPAADAAPQPPAEVPPADPEPEPPKPAPKKKNK